MTSEELDKVTHAANAAITEMQSAIAKHGWFNSRHEGYAALLEEMDELWDEIKADGPPQRIFAEAVQVGAMALEIAAQYGKDEA